MSEDWMITIVTELVVDEEKLRGGVRFIDRLPRNEFGKLVRPKLSVLLQSWDWTELIFIFFQISSILCVDCMKKFVTFPIFYKYWIQLV